ncbi:hypothetical protein XA68_14725 [Ophiocordyceps unilateralis]|uniref:Condensation domain-containing protein n=1 Tax=Ophiocordyceps unilateralis TaxID=268505 RepID=A0A2A9PLT4_OPHUN|nr:hypothetical protein XA68_14725 [Ophiocordyceps unilateralis]
MALEDSDLVTSTRLVHIGEALPYDITAATMVKVAWAVLLARLSGSAQGVFAQASNGRNYDLAKDMVGMCLNFLPVRTSIDPEERVSELAEFIQRQHHESLAHELIDFADIVQRSTSWETGTKHQTVIVHQNLEPDEIFQLGDAEAWVTCSYEWPHPPDEILIESFPKGNGNLQMTMDTRSNILRQKYADAVMDKLCRLIELVARLAGDSQARVATLLHAAD